MSSILLSFLNSQSVFIGLSFLALLSALLVVFSKNPVHSVLYLIVTFFAIAGHYVLLGAHFLAVVHIVVYAGAIMVLFLTVIMLLNLNHDTEPQKGVWMKGIAVVAGGLLLVTFVGALRGAETLTAAQNVNPNLGTIENLGMVLFNDFLVPFELSSALLLGGMVGAVLLGKKEKTNLIVK